jgi:hypothetical protein
LTIKIESFFSTFFFFDHFDARFFFFFLRGRFLLMFKFQEIIPRKSNKNEQNQVPGWIQFVEGVSTTGRPRQFRRGFFLVVWPFFLSIRPPELLTTFEHVVLYEIQRFVGSRYFRVSFLFFFPVYALCLCFLRSASSSVMTKPRGQGSREERASLR